MSDSLTYASELAAAVATATHERDILKAVRSFLRFLQGVPDSAPAEWSHESLARLGKTSEDVVAAIERAIEGAGKAGSSARTLAEEIYAIRRALEGIDHWERHFLGSA